MTNVHVLVQLYKMHFSFYSTSQKALSSEMARWHYWSSTNCNTTCQPDSAPFLFLLPLPPHPSTWTKDDRHLRTHLYQSLSWVRLWDGIKTGPSQATPQRRRGPCSLVSSIWWFLGWRWFRRHMCIRTPGEGGRGQRGKKTQTSQGNQN